WPPEPWTRGPMFSWPDRQSLATAMGRPRPCSGYGSRLWARQPPPIEYPKARRNLDMTQFEAGRQGIITQEMAFAPSREALHAELIRNEVARGRMVIPANVHHRKRSLEPMCIGIAARCKINANIGNSAVTGTIEEELEKLHTAVYLGADTVMDLSTGGNID